MRKVFPDDEKSVGDDRNIIGVRFTDVDSVGRSIHAHGSILSGHFDKIEEIDLKSECDEECQKDCKFEHMLVTNKSEISISTLITYNHSNTILLHLLRNYSYHLRHLNT